MVREGDEIKKSASLPVLEQLRSIKQNTNSKPPLKHGERTEIKRVTVSTTHRFRCLTKQEPRVAWGCQLRGVDQRAQSKQT